MKVVVFGATGKTGKLVVERALDKGHEVTVLVRDAARVGIGLTEKGVQVVVGDATNADDVLKAVRGQDAVIEAIGGTTPYKETTLETTVATNIVAAMKTAGVGRLIVVSMMGIGDSKDEAPFWYKNLLMPTFLHGATKDKTEKEDVVRESGLQYVIARPPILDDGPATGSVKVIGEGDTGHKITRADLADWLVEQVDSDLHVGRAVTVVNS